MTVHPDDAHSGAGSDGAARGEAEVLAQVGGASPAPATAQSYGELPLREAAPEAYRALVEAYGALLDSALEARAYRVQPRAAEARRDLVERLGFFWARPRDVVEVHTSALAARTQTAASGKGAAYAEEGRIVLVEVLGGLVSHYRKLSLGRGTG
jgi:hypothetical protein